jgi:ribosomal protein S12 methylthiotransferase
VLITESPVELLKALAQVDGVEWIRLLYLYPDGISDEMIRVDEVEQEICEVL